MPFRTPHSLGRNRTRLWLEIPSGVAKHNVAKGACPLHCVSDTYLVLDDLRHGREHKKPIVFANSRERI